jgi:CRISPR-associated endonuclease/helicase Cas3
MHIFSSLFSALTNAPEPFPWQEELFAMFTEGKIPSCCDIPTGLGKTSVIAIWLLALAKLPTKCRADWQQQHDLASPE